jgi:hypothetical protein
MDALGLVDFKYSSERFFHEDREPHPAERKRVFSEPANILWKRMLVQRCSVTKVEFFEAKLYGSDRFNTYRLSWNNVAAGNYIIAARATGSDGITALSHPVTITVNPAVISAQSSALSVRRTTLPSLRRPTSALACNAKDSDGNVAKVEFFDESV